jgi:branched-chain amino acid aminotransferase
MINLNGKIINDSIIKNRALLYADALFDTLIVNDNQIVFLEAHYFRLLAGMRQLRMEIPSYFTQNYWKQEILHLLETTKLSNARVRTTVFRDSDGLYTPNVNTSNYLIQIDKLKYQTKDTFKLGIYKDNLLSTNSIDNIKTTNKVINVLAAIYAKEQEFDTCLLLNHKRHIAETTYANLFVVFGNQIKTPSLTEGCVKGIIRQKLIEIIQKETNFELTETEISPYELQQADEVFITNSVIGIQPVTHYKKRVFKKETSMILQEKLKAKSN